MGHYSVTLFCLVSALYGEYDETVGSSSGLPAPALVRQIPTVRFVLAIWLS